MKTETAIKSVFMDATPGATGGGAPAAPAVAPTTAPAPAAPAIAWMPDAPPELAGFIQTKGWAGPQDAVNSYQNLEKLFGADRAGRTVALPADDSDPAAWNAVYDKLGRPSTPDLYKLNVPEGVSPDFAKAASAKFHELGLTVKQAQTLAEWNNENSAQIQQQETLAMQAALDTEHAELEKDWGAKTTPAYQAQKELAKRALAHYGLDEKAIDALESVAGFKQVMKSFAAIGQGLAEPGDRGMSGGNGAFSMTPEAAKARKSQLMADKDWAGRAMQPNSKEWAEVVKLNQIIAASM